MKSLPQLEVTFKGLFEMVVMQSRLKLLVAGIKLKVFDQLGQEKSAPEVAEIIGAHELNTGFFLDGLAASGLVFKKDGRYRNTPVAQAFLKQGEPTYLGPILMVWAQAQNGLGDDLLDLVKNGPPPPRHDDAEGEDLWRQYIAMTANLARSGMAQQMAGMVSELPEFASCKRMLDLGGGSGVIGLAITAAHPTMEGVVFDQPAVVTVAEELIAEYGMQERMTVLGSDFNHDSIGAEYDLIWASSVFNYVKADMAPLMAKALGSLNPGGVLVCCSDGMTHEGTQPMSMILSWLPEVLAGNDLRLDQGAVADAMLRAGFRSVCSRTIETQVGPMELDIGRK